MKNKQTVSWNNVPFETWKYKKQTQMKHKVFCYYLPVWLQILGSVNKNLNYIDGFGGIGAYHTYKDIKKKEYISDCFGSPIISIETIFELQKNKKITKANVIIIDEDVKNIENIKKILKFKKLSTDKIKFEIGDFDKKINEGLDFLEKNQSKLAPTFFLLDPFGIKGIKLNTLERIMNIKGTEILLNFMYNSLQRWITHPNTKIQKIYDEYFGGDEWRKCKGKYLFEKEEMLTCTFRKKCKDFSRYVYRYRFNFPYKKQTYYYLFHLTNYWKGCSLMKDSFAKFNDGKDQYMGETHQSSLFESLDKKEKKECFKDKLISFYGDKPVKIVDIYKDFIDETDLLQKEIYKILQLLEKNKKIQVNPCNNRKRRGGFNNKDVISFKRPLEINDKV